MADEPTAAEPGTGAEPAPAGQPTGDTTPQPAQGEPAASAPQAGTAEPDIEWRKRAQDWEKRSKANKAELDQLKAGIEADRAERAARDEADKARNLALAKFLGFAPDDPPDPAKLAADLKAAQDQATADRMARDARERELTIELATLKGAGKHGADPVLLADSRSFMTAAAKLDPASGSFADDLSSLIAAHVEANPSLKAVGKPAAPAAQPAGNASATTAPPARSGGEHNGAPGGNRQWTEADVGRASPAEVTEAIEAGLLVDLGFAPSRKRR